MSNLPPLPVLCDTPPPIDDFSNIPDDDYVDFDGIGDDYDDVVIEEPSSKLKSFQATQSIGIDEPEDDTPLPYLGTRLPPDGTDMTLDFPGDTNNGRNIGLDLDSPPSLHLSSGSGNDKISDKFEVHDDFITKQVIDDSVSCENVLENVDASMTTSQQHTLVLHDTDRHIEGGSDENDELEENLNKSQFNSEINVTQENLVAQQSNLNIAFDDFTDFQSVPPDKCDENSSQENWYSEPVVTTDELTFDVDFSNFQADFSEIPPEIKPSVQGTTQLDVSFDNFQDFCSAGDDQKELESKDNAVISEIPPVMAKTEVVDDEDDDFGDFNDFQTIAVKTLPLRETKQEVQEPLPTLTLETFKKIVDLMFPDSSSQVDDKDNDKKTFDAIPFENNVITSKLKDIELSRALSYRYASSVSSNTLMESIGIDSKNVLFGMKWNPGMPRYAANLSFDPIQPQPLLLQPTPVVTQVAAASTSASKSNESNNVLTSLSSKQSSKEEPVTQVPAASFDWSSAGLVNPLDGSPQIPSAKSTTVIDPVSASTGSQLTSNVVVDEEKVSSLIPSAASSIMDEVSTTGTSQYSDSSYSFKSDSSEMHHQTPLSPTYGMSVRTITLPETHIFTPEKCTNAISQSVDRGDAKGVKGGEVTASGIAVKEYHDVEYKLDKSLTSDCLSSISINSISENSVLNHLNSLSQPVLAPSMSIDPIVESMSSKMSLKPDSVKGGTAHNNANYIKKDKFPIFGTSPTDMGEKKGNEDDDFSDFQAAPVVKATPVEPIKPKAVQASALLNTLPLSPVHLMRSAANSTLPEPDDDEMLRIEAFARSKSQSQSKPTNNNTDDDEWTDFTSAMPPSQAPKTITTNNKNTSHDDDWSDFVFTTPASMKPIIANHHRQTQKPPPATGTPSWNHQIFQQGNYMPWSTSTGQTPINHIQAHQFSSSSMQHQQPPHQNPGMPELNFIQSQKTFVNAPNRHQMMRK